MPRRGVRIIECVSHADAFERLLPRAVEHVGGLNARRFQNRRHDVDDVVELRANLPLRLDPFGPTKSPARFVFRRNATPPASSTGKARPSRAPTRPDSGCKSGRCPIDPSSKTKTRVTRRHTAPTFRSWFLEACLRRWRRCRPHVDDESVVELA